VNLEKELQELKTNVTPLQTAKFLVGTVISCGAMAAIVAALRNPIQGARGLTKLIMRLGVFVLGCKAGDIAENYFNATVDDVVKAYNEAKQEEKVNEQDSNGR